MGIATTVHVPIYFYHLRRAREAAESADKLEARLVKTAGLVDQMNDEEMASRLRDFVDVVSHRATCFLLLVAAIESSANHVLLTEHDLGESGGPVGRVNRCLKHKPYESVSMARWREYKRLNQKALEYIVQTRREIQHPSAGAWSTELEVPGSSFNFVFATAMLDISPVLLQWTSDTMKRCIRHTSYAIEHVTRKSPRMTLGWSYY